MKTVLLSSAFVAGLALGWGTLPTPSNDPRNFAATPAAALVKRSADTTSAVPADRGNNQPKDFAQRFEDALRIGNQFKRTRAIAAIADNLDAAEVAAGLDQLARVGDFFFGSERHAIAKQLFARWGELDPSAALRRAMSFPMERNLAVEAIVQGWAEKDAASAEAWFAEFHSPLREAARRGLVTSLSETDPKRAFSLIAAGSQWSDQRLAEALFSEWTERAPSEAAAHAAQLPAGYFRRDALNLVARQWASVDGLSAVAWAESMPDTGAAREAGIVGRNLSAFSADPLMVALQTWMRRDVDSATEWLEQIPDQEKKQALLGSVISLIAADDPERAAQRLASAILPEKERNAALKDLVRSWNYLDSRGALAWAAQQRDAETRAVVVLTLAGELADSGGLAPQDAETALDLAQSLTGDAQQRATANILKAWTLRDPGGAAMWAGQQPANAEYLRNVVYPWARKDPMAASQWVSSLPASEAKDQVLSQAADARNLRIAPEVAAEWIAQVSDAHKREQAYTTFARNWLRSDAKTARQWISTAPLPEDVRAQLLSPDAR